MRIDSILFMVEEFAEGNWGPVLEDGWPYETRQYHAAALKATATANQTGNICRVIQVIRYHIADFAGEKKDELLPADPGGVKKQDSLRDSG